MLHCYKNHLPHWRADGSIYSITIHLLNGILSESERDLILTLVRKYHNLKYNLYIVLVMPNQVHLVLQPFGESSLATIMQQIKGVSARLINLERKKTGSIWIKDSYDRIIRNEKEQIETINYIHYNPVRAGIVEHSEQYRWCYVPEDEVGD